MKNNEWKCPFCGSSKPFIETPYIDRITGDKKTTYCCLKQKQNSDYSDKRYGRETIDVPSRDDISRL